MAVAALAGATGADASTLWVAPVAPSAPFNSCAHPGYDSIQAAISGPGTAIHVCAGTYEEQLQIQRGVTITGYGGVTLKLPASPRNATTPCDAANEALDHNLPDQDLVSVCGGKVKIESMRLEAIWPGNPIEAGESCAYGLAGVFVAGSANFTLSGSTVIGAAPKEINGCQYGLGVIVGIPGSKALGAATATLTSDAVGGYQKNGITAAGEEVDLKASHVIVTGGGIEPAIAQNGIGIQEGAKGTILDSTVSDNECGDVPACGPDALTQYASDGVYFYDAGAGSSVTGTTSDENDVGIEAFDTAGVPRASKDKAEFDRYSAVEISEGGATVEHCTLTHSGVGIQLVQFSGQAAAISGSASHDTIKFMSEWAVLGRSDKAEGDLPGEFTITGSKISGNPGPTPQKSVESESTTLKIFAEKDT
ncbi:MAG TPA: hypothetical protein VGY13_04470 [Solirubrobacteraceae bacterium]|jgi:hypothetical protein|nr:hypothetical protein [Solirubrobacteraceae bacterium]